MRRRIKIQVKPYLPRHESHLHHRGLEESCPLVVPPDARGSELTNKFDEAGTLPDRITEGNMRQQQFIQPHAYHII